MAKKKSETLRAPMTSQVRTLQTRASALQRFHPERIGEIAELRRLAAVTHLEDHIKRATSRHSLTGEERDHLVRVLGIAR